MNRVNNVCVRSTATLVDDFDNSITCEEYYMQQYPEDPIVAEIHQLLDRMEASIQKATEAANKAHQHLDNAQVILDNMEQTNGTSETNRL